MTIDTRLDDAARFQQFDPNGLVGLIESFGTHAAEAVALADSLSQIDSLAGATNIVFLGMGGSAIGSELAGALIDLAGTVPMSVVRDYRLPNHVGDQTLVVAASYSGNTEETLAALEAARAKTKRILVLTSGGLLELAAKEHQFATVMIPAGLPPRASVMYFFVGLVRFLERAGYLPEQLPVAKIGSVLSEGAAAYGRSVVTDGNPTKQLALALETALPIIVGAEHLGPVTTRWKNELNENGKSLAYPDRVPELLHNTLLGLEFPTSGKPLVRFVFLESPLYHERNRKRYELFKPMVRQQGYELETVQFDHGTRFGEMLQAVQFGSFVSAYLGVLHERDPYDFSQIEAFKAALGEKQQ